MDALRLSALEEIYDHNPAYANLYAKACLLCPEPVEEAALVSGLSAGKAGFGQLQDVASILASLVSRGALVCEHYVDGVLYEGDMRQLQQDETIPEDAHIESFYRATEEGAAVALAHSPENLVMSLFSERPDCIPGFRVVLGACREEGASTKDLQELLRSRKALPVDPETGMEKFYASYFTTALEKAGALEWVDRKWRTTVAGEKALDGAVV